MRHHHRNSFLFFFDPIGQSLAVSVSPSRPPPPPPRCPSHVLLLLLFPAHSRLTPSALLALVFGDQENGSSLALDAKNKKRESCSRKSPFSHPFPCLPQKNSLPLSLSTASPSSTSATPASPSATTTSACSPTRSSPATQPGTRARPPAPPPLRRPPRTRCFPRRPSSRRGWPPPTQTRPGARSSTRGTSAATRIRATSTS